MSSLFLDMKLFLFGTLEESANQLFFVISFLSRLTSTKPQKNPEQKITELLFDTIILFLRFCELCIFLHFMKYI